LAGVAEASCVDPPPEPELDELAPDELAAGGVHVAAGVTTALEWAGAVVALTAGWCCLGAFFA
jgi:hypothetical protein